MNLRSSKRKTQMIILFGLFFFMMGCKSAYYSTMEKFGKEKRHILVDNVEDVQERCPDTDKRIICF